MNQKANNPSVAKTDTEQRRMNQQFQQATQFQIVSVDENAGVLNIRLPKTVRGSDGKQTSLVKVAYTT